MTINFPWGSLLRGVLGHDEAALAGVATLLAPGATAHVLFSVTARDGVPEPHPRLGAVYVSAGLQLAEIRPATAAEIAASGSTWAKKLRAGSARPVTRLTLCRPTSTGPKC
jgi:16S rRNA (adenine(1408)-N(1))-methyltransferase